MSTNRNKNRRQLPPLNALRAFEAVARFLSFTKAAEELLVTQSAVSRQVKNLEDILGVALILRKAQLELTEEGKRLLPVLTDSFDRMDVVIGSFRRQSKKPPLSLALPPTFARRVVLQHLPQFQAANPDLEIRIETPPVNPDFRNSGHDLAVFHGELDLDADGLIADVLMRERFSPLATPDLIKKAGWPDIKTMVAKAPLLHGESARRWRRGGGRSAPLCRGSGGRQASRPFRHQHADGAHLHFGLPPGRNRTCPDQRLPRLGPHQPGGSVDL